MVFLIGRVLYGGFFVISGARHFINLKSMSAYASSRGFRCRRLLYWAPGS